MARDDEVFERLVMPHLGAAYNLARWLVHDRAMADDVVQEAMLRALRFHGGLRGDAKPWLLQIVRRAAIAAMQARRSQPAAALDRPDAADPAAGPETILSQQQDRQILLRALAALPDEYRECLVLRELEEMSYKEIAAITSVPIGTVMSRLWRARQLLSSSGK